MKRWAALPALAIAALLILTSCAAPRSRNQLVFGVTFEYKSLNPLYMSGADRIAIGALVFNRLLGANAKGDLIPEVAAVVPSQQNGGISANGLTITYHLRRDVRWADGEPLTARDVVFTHEADISPRNAAIETYGDNLVTSVVALDAYTVRVWLKASFIPFLAYFDRPILPAHLLEKYASLDKVDYNEHPVGSGPYRVADWVRGDHLTFVRSDSYWGKHANIDSIVLRTIPDENTLVLQLRGHDIDAATSIDPNRAALLASDRTLRLVKTPTPLFGLIIFNASDPRLADVRVRRAFTMALDRKRVVALATHGFEDPSHPNKALFAWAYDPAIGEIPYDPAGARKLLDDAGWRPGPDGIRTKGNQRLALTLVSQSAHPFLLSELAQFAQQAKAVGIQVDTKLFSDQAFLLLTSAGVLWGGRFDVALTEFVGGGDPDPDWLIGCDAKGKPNPYNFSHMCIPGIDAPIRDAVTNYDRARETRDYRMVQRALDQWVPIVLISQSASLAAVPVRLHNFDPNPYMGDLWNVSSWWLSPD